MANIFLYDIIRRSAEIQLKAQNIDGSMPSGINGPWRDISTSVRNTAHWALLFYKAYEISKEDRFLRSALSACDYLLSDKARPHKASFLCLLTKNRPPENGLIGQAWAVEPLIFIGRALDRKDYLTLAQEVLIKHEYDKKLHLWYNLGINGKRSQLNPTFNQQLWFAVMNLILGKEANHKLLLSRARDFFKHLKNNMKFVEPGLIQQRTKLTNEYSRETLLYRSIGYLSFNLYALALGYSNAPEEEWWSLPWFKDIILEIINYAQNDKFISESYHNQFAWSYNPFGFEIAYALYAFQNLLNIDASIDSLRFWIEKQLIKHWDHSSSLMNINTVDPITLAARLYEATRLPNIELCLNNCELNLEREQIETHK